MVNYEIKKITKQKKKEQVVWNLLEELRTADRRELAACTDESGSVENEVYDSVFWSEECFAAYDRTGLIAVWGHRELPGLTGRLIWCLGTDRVQKNRYAFAVESKRILDEWANRYGVLYNAVGAFNKDAIQWLKYCGAVFHKETVIGSERFIPFTIEGEGRK
nr:MAG TPA: internal virion protein A [Caudoviricetes sp.]